MLTSLQEEVLEANLDLVELGLVMGTWGNASGIDPEGQVVVIKPSGMPCDEFSPEDMVVVDLDGNVVQGDLVPSSDTATHLALYKAFPDIGGIVHTHFHYATCWAQACRAIPCLGTTHADYFYGEVPVTAVMTEVEVRGDYERNTGESIIRSFAGLDPLSIRGVLVAQHGPFTWGETVFDAVEAAIVLEDVASLALHTLALSPRQGAIAQHLLDRHFLRKHGEDSYYGQEGGRG